MVPHAPAEQVALAEQLAADALSFAGLTAPVDPRRLAAALGFQVEIRTWAELGVFGAVRGRRILVARTQPARVRWTIAHEIGHVLIGDRTGHDSAHAEALANRVAGALLIPRTVVAAGPIDLPVLAARCRTSLEGTAHRILDLVPSAVAVVEHRRPPRARSSHLAPEAPAPRALELAEAALSRRGFCAETADGWRVAAWTTPAGSRAVALAIAL